MGLNNRGRRKSRDSSSVQAWPYHVSRPSRSLAIATGRTSHSPYRTRLHDWSIVFLLVLIIVTATVLSGIGVSLLFDDGMQVSSDEPYAGDPSSDARVRELLQVHRHVVLGR